MGMFDTVLVPCPKCGVENDFQSKSGPRLQERHKLEDCPEDILLNVNRHSPIECKNCLTYYFVDLHLVGTPKVCDKRQEFEVANIDPPWVPTKRISERSKFVSEPGDLKWTKIEFKTESDEDLRRYLGDKPSFSACGIKGDDNLFETGIFNGYDDAGEPVDMQWEEGRSGEWICAHGVGHGGDHLKTVGYVHGCCGKGCCSRPDYPGRKRT